MARMLATVLTVFMGTSLTPDAARAASEAGTTLPLNGFYELLVDEPRQHVFVTGGVGNSTVQVLNYDGSVAGEITGISGAAGMVLTGTTLYVARMNGNAIDVVDVTTLQVVDTLALPTITSGEIALAGGKLWYLNDECSDFGNLASVDPVTETVETHTAFSYYCADFATHAAEPNSLIVGVTSLSPASLYKLDVSGTPTQVANHWDPAGSSNLAEVATAFDGQTLFTASGAPYLIPEFQMSDLVETGTTYPTGPYPIGVDTSSPDYLAAAVNASSGPDLKVFPVGNTQPVQTADFECLTNPDLYRRGVALTSDAQHVFAVAGRSDGVAVFHALGGPLGTGTQDPCPAGSPSPGPSPVPPAPGPGLGSKVATTTSGELLGGNRSGRYQSYKRSQDPLYIVTVDPPQEGELVLFEGQVQFKGKWRDLPAKSFPQAANGVVGVRVKNVRPGFRYRIGASFDGDADSMGSRSGWSYFMVKPRR